MARPERFDPDTLYEKINGQAEQYLKFGFQELWVVSLEHPQSETTLDVFLYRQGSFADSIGLYREQRGQRALVSREGVHFTQHPLGALGTVGPYFFQLLGDPAGPALEAEVPRSHILIHQGCEQTESRHMMLEDCEICCSLAS